MGIAIIVFGLVFIIIILILRTKYPVWAKIIFILLFLIIFFVAISLLFAWGFERGLNRGLCERMVKNSECLECINEFEEQNRELQWRELRCGLWENKYGEVGFQTQMAVCDENCFTERYITRVYLGYDGKDTTLLSVVDTATFHAYGAFYKDKNHIYEHYNMSDGGNFRILRDVDYDTFQILELCYAKDKEHIYCVRHGIVDADYSTFEEAKGGRSCLGRDKNGYFFWGERTDFEDLDDNEMKDLKRRFEADK